MKGDIKASILRQIEESPENSIFFLSDFSGEGAIESVRKIFLQARLSGVLVHLTHGIYAKPKKSRFGVVPPSLELIAKKIAERDHVQIVPSGYTAINLLGLSTQVPMTLTYLTTGSTREVKIGNRSIKFRHAAHKNFAAKGQTVILIIQALKELGKDNIGQSEISQLKSYIAQAKDRNLIPEDLLLAPQWIQKFLKPLIPDPKDETLAIL